jgi:hypothetical protein
MKIVMISLPNKLVKRESLDLDTTVDDPSDWHVSCFTAIGNEIIIATERGSYYSYLFDIKEHESFLPLLQKVIPGTHKFIKMRSASVLARLSAIQKKAQYLLEHVAKEKTPVNLEEVMKTLNETPWKFLHSVSPSELRKVTDSYIQFNAS